MPHSLSPFTHCPVCGSPRFEVNDCKSKRCPDCGFVYYINPSAATAAFILREGQLLVALRAKEPARGTLDLPGGFTYIGETAEQGIAREVAEETGLHARSVSYLFSLPNDYLYSCMHIPTLDLFFRVEVDAHEEAHAADDAAELMWLPVGDVRPELFGLGSIRRAVEAFIAVYYGE